jgi:hypothetical protein
MVVDSVFYEINEPSVDLRAFLIIVDRAALKVLKTRISSIKQEDLKSWGYEIQGSRLYRRKK